MTLNRGASNFQNIIFFNPENKGITFTDSNLNIHLTKKKSKGKSLSQSGDELDKPGFVVGQFYSNTFQINVIWIKNPPQSESGYMARFIILWQTTRMLGRSGYFECFFCSLLSLSHSAMINRTSLNMLSRRKKCFWYFFFMEQSFINDCPAMQHESSN